MSRLVMGKCAFVCMRVACMHISHVRVHIDKCAPSRMHGMVSVWPKLYEFAFSGCEKSM